MTHKEMEDSIATVNKRQDAQSAPWRRQRKYQWRLLQMPPDRGGERNRS